MADGLRTAFEQAEKVLPPEEKERLAEEIMKAVRTEKMRKRKAFIEWIQNESPLTGRGHELREVHEEFKRGFAFPSDLDESEE